MDFPTLFFEPSENIFHFVFISLFVSFGICIYEYFVDTVRWKMKLQTEDIY